MRSFIDDVLPVFLVLFGIFIFIGLLMSPLWIGNIIRPDTEKDSREARVICGEQQIESFGYDYDNRLQVKCKSR